MRRAEGKKLTQRREDAKGLTWRLCGFSEAGVRILKEDKKLRKSEDEKFRRAEGERMRGLYIIGIGYVF